MNCENVNWSKLKTEYITTDTSYRKLAEKYEVSQSTLRKIAAREQWVELKNKFGTARDTEMANLLGAEAGQKTAELDQRYFDIIEKLLDKAEYIIDATPIWQVSTVKEMATAMKYIKECKGIKSDADKREQEARIRALEKNCGDDGDEDNTGVILLPTIQLNGGN